MRAPRAKGLKMRKTFTPKIHVAKSGALVYMDKGLVLYSVILRNPAGEVFDKVKCEDKKLADSMFKAFKATVNNNWS